VKARANDTSVCWYPSRLCRLGLSRRSSMAVRLRISRSPGIDAGTKSATCGRLLLQEPDAPLLLGPRIQQRLGEASCQRSGLRRSALRLICPLLTPAPRSSILTDRSVSKPETRRRSPEVRSTAFTARPPDLPPRSLMAVDFAIRCSLVRPGRPRDPVLVHRAAALLHASFRPHLAMTPLRFANPSPPSGWIEDFHLQAVDHARHTTKRAAWRPPL
jgi:hypothetical protein